MWDCPARHLQPTLPSLHPARAMIRHSRRLTLMPLLLLATLLHGADLPPDLTQKPQVDRKETYNLGATGLRGWIHTKPASHRDSIQGRTTTASRQILVTHVGAKSPADGVMQVDDVILGVNGRPFEDDARKSFALAIQEAEKESNKGVLRVTRWRAGATGEVELHLNVMGTYSATAPYKCAKSQRIFEAACAVLAQEPLEANWHGAISGLALLSTGKAEYLPKLREYAHQLAPPDLKLELKRGMVTWDWGYRGLFLCEYYLQTGDKEVLPAIREYTVSLAKGQSLYGTFGHGISALTPDGKLHGSIPPYGPVNEAGLIGNLAIVLGKKCGIKDPEIDPAIKRSNGFFAYYVDKGSIPYGEHEPWPYHENNGKVSMSAVLFAVQGDHPKEARFFAQMATAGYDNRQIGHTGQGFSYLWSALGANVGGPKALAAFFKECSWHLDLVRRCDGSFTYDGQEQYGPGHTDDNTYYGKSSYNGLSPAATYVLTYALPLRKLCITGKGMDPEQALSGKEVAAAIAAGRFDVECRKMTPAQLVAAFADWSPIVRSWAAEELAKRPEAKGMTPELITLAGGKDVHVAQGACEALGLIKSQEALPVLVRQLSHKDRWLRYKAAQAIRKMGGDAKPAIADILKALADTAEPVLPVQWADPIQLAHGQLSAAVFQTPLIDAAMQADRKLLYQAVRAVSRNPDGMARATIRELIEKRLVPEDLEALAPDLVEAVRIPCPADTMFGNEIRMGAFMALSRLRYKEGIELGAHFAATQSGHGSENRTAVIMKELVGYGAAAKPVIPALKEVIVAMDAEAARGEFPGGAFNARRTDPIREAIATIEAATTQPELRSLSKE